MSDEALIQAILGLGQLSLAFGRVERGTRHEDGITPESDTDHTVMLGLIGCAMAPLVRADLDVGLIAQYALVHDVVEVHAGDTNTLRQPHTASRLAKKDRERRALDRIREQFGPILPWLPERIADYESQATPEARYVKALDKVLPKITHVLNDLAAVDAQQISVTELTDRYRAQAEELAGYAGDFPLLLQVHAALVGQMLHQATSITCRR